MAYALLRPWKGVTELGCGIQQSTRPVSVCRYKSGDTLTSATANMRGTDSCTTEHFVHECMPAGAYEENVRPKTKTADECSGGSSGGSSAGTVVAVLFVLLVLAALIAVVAAWRMGKLPLSCTDKFKLPFRGATRSNPLASPPQTLASKQGMHPPTAPTKTVHAPAKAAPKAAPKTHTHTHADSSVNSSRHAPAKTGHAKNPRPVFGQA